MSRAAFCLPDRRHSAATTSILRSPAVGHTDIDGHRRSDAVVWATVSVRILFVGEIVGKAGVFCLKQSLAHIKQTKEIDFVLANGDGATGGFGLGKNHSVYIRKLGVDVITSGDQIFYKKDTVASLNTMNTVLRPANLPPGSPGRGWRHYAVGKTRVGVVNLLGQSGFAKMHGSNPFTFLPEIVSRLKEDASVVIVDFHAATTAEKYSMFHHADGQVAAVVGTGQRAITADSRVSDAGTATLCDAGRTGSIQSVGGLDPEIEIRQYLRQIPERSAECFDGLEIQGAVIDIDDSGKATGIEILRIPCVPPEENEEAS